MDPRSMTTPGQNRLFHKPPAGRVTLTQDQGDFVDFLAPYYTAARQTGSRKEFLDMVYILSFGRFPVTVESEDPDKLEWAITAQKKFVWRKLICARACKKPKLDEHWEEVLTLEANRTRRCDRYYTCREWGYHLSGHQYMVTIEKEEDKLPIPAEEFIRRWSESMTDNANIFEPF